MSMITLPSSASPKSATTAAALPYGTARMTMSPAGAAPYVPVVAPAASLSASARALAGSRLTTSTVCPALAIRPRDRRGHAS